MTVPPDVHPPRAVLADTSWTPAGRASVRVTPVAGLGPALRTVSVYVTCPRIMAEAGADLTTERSAEGEGIGAPLAWRVKTSAPPQHST